MSNQDKAQELLAASYFASAKRIARSLEGNLAISNSRQPDFPPTGLGEIIGLCGQSGRHPYFRIPVDDLQSCLRRILDSEGRLGFPNVGVGRVVEEIAGACQVLRQQTYFDDGTGCVNDSLPSMVPLLPPEEIWFEGRELPLDVWRLISFEFDLVSASVSSQTSVGDFAFSAVNQSALAFRFLIGQLGSRRTRFALQASNVPADWLPATGTPLTIDVSLARLFVEAGSLLTPFADQEFIKGYTAIRYTHWIDDLATELRVQDRFDKDSVDARYRGVFAEETAIGLMAIVLSDVFGAKPITNTVEALEALRPGSLQPNQPIADFVAQATHPTTQQPTTIIAESKGSLGHLVSKARRERAKTQVAATNVNFAGFTQTLPVTFASTIFFSGQNGNTHCLVEDPPMDRQTEFFEIDPVYGWRLSYAKALKFVGLETAAKQVFRGEPAESIRSMDFDRERVRQRSERDQERNRRASIAKDRFGMELLLDVGECALSIDPQIANVLRHGINEESQHKIAAVLRSRHQLAGERYRGPSFEMSLGLGCVFYSDLDEEQERG